MPWIYMLVIDTVCVVTFYLLIMHGHPYAAIFPMLAAATNTIKQTRAK